MKRVILSSNNIDAVDKFLDEVSNKDILDIDLKLIIQAKDQFISDYKNVPDEWKDKNIDLDTVYKEQHEFYKKYIEFARKCRDILKTLTPGSGYGSNSIKQYKMYDILKSIDYIFPYGWKH